MMNKDHYWKNVNLNKELHIAGTFLYDAISCLEKMRHFCFEDECFSFLYNVSVGIERLEKIVIILLEHNSGKDQEQFEKSLITHNHLELIKRIEKMSSLNLGKEHTKFLNLLSDFYNSYRYDRYNLPCEIREDKDQLALISFVSESLDIEIQTGMMFPTEIDKQIRNFLGKIVGKIATQLYKIIREAKTFTHELRYDSKAAKIFYANEKEYNFVDERICQKEILVYLMNNQNTNNGLIDFIKSIKPLELNPAVNNEYVKFLFDIRDDNYGVVDEISQIYEDNGFDKERFEMLSLIGEDDVSFDRDEVYD
jgi:hypothetical protein